MSKGAALPSGVPATEWFSPCPSLWQDFSTRTLLALWEQCLYLSTFPHFYRGCQVLPHDGLCHHRLPGVVHHLPLLPPGHILHCSSVEESQWKESFLPLIGTDWCLHNISSQYVHQGDLHLPLHDLGSLHVLLLPGCLLLDAEHCIRCCQHT